MLPRSPATPHQCKENNMLSVPPYLQAHMVLQALPFLVSPGAPCLGAQIPARKLICGAAVAGDAGGARDARVGVGGTGGKQGALGGGRLRCRWEGG